MNGEQMTAKTDGNQVVRGFAPKPPHNADNKRELADSEYIEVIRESRKLAERDFEVIETIKL